MPTRSRPRQHHVYKLLSRGAVAYVGRSLYPRARWRAAEQRTGRKFVLEIASSHRSFAAAQRAELALIDALSPPLNRWRISSPGTLGKRKDNAGRRNPNFGRPQSAEARRRMRSAWTPERHVAHARRMRGMWKKGGPLSKAHCGA